MLVESGPKNIIAFRDNAIVSCLTVGIFISGRGAAPFIVHNVFMVCKCPAISLNT